MRSENASKYADLINSIKPDLIYGYASSIHALSKLVKDYDVHLAKLIVTTSEKLYPEWRDDICRLGVQLRDLYSSQEGNHFAFECSEGRVHVHPARGVVEVLTASGPQNCGTGKLLVTGIRRPTFPLFRYTLGDVVTLLPTTECKCGRTSQVISAIEGRSEDLVLTRDGRELGYLNFHATKNVSGLFESQLVQKGWEDFEFIFVPNADRACIRRHRTQAWHPPQEYTPTSKDFPAKEHLFRTFLLKDDMAIGAIVEIYGVVENSRYFS